MRQSSHLPPGLPALLGVLAAVYPVAPDTLHAQEPYRLKWSENFRRDPDPQASLLATVEGGIQVPVVGREGGWLQVMLEGWIWAQSVSPDAREGHDLVVSARAGENLRVEPNGPRVARLAGGTLLDQVERNGAWIRVRRTGWMFGQSLEAIRSVGPSVRRSDNTAGAQTPRRSDAQSRDASAAVGLDRGVTRDRTALHPVPDGDTLGTLGAGAPVKVLARSGGWVRIQTEAWIREEDLKPSAPGVLVGVSAAEVRTRPDEFVGKVLQWTVQYIAIQSPGELRPEIPEGRPYVLARGPQPEQGFIYLIVTDDQIARFRRLPELADLVILGRVKVARSRHLQVPVLELLEMQVK